MSKVEKKIMRRRIVNAYLSSVISISLVLLLVGIAGLLLVNAESISNYFKENVRVTIMMKTEVTDRQALKAKEKMQKLPFIHSLEFVSKEEGKKEMTKMLGENFLEVFETSPIPASITLTLKANYVTPDSLSFVRKQLVANPLVDEVVYQHSLVEALNSNLSKISMVLGVLIILLLFISFVLINNTMRLILYSRRFSIHTMRLVGATKSFIRRPFLRKSLLLGFISSILAIIMLLLMMYFLKTEFEQIFEIFKTDLLLIVMGIVLACGLIICYLSTYFAIGKLVTLSRDDIYT